MKLYHDVDVADSDALRQKTVAVLGYGIQGRAQALCLHDAGFQVVVGLRKDGASWKQAGSDGLQVAELTDACRQADVICMLVPDMNQPQVFADTVLPHLTPGKTLYFSHGFCITYGLIRPPQGVDVVMVAPKAPGAKVRQAFLDPVASPVPCLVAVHQDSSGHALQTALQMAKAMKLTRAGAFECSFDQETHSDLFGEQAVLCGGVTELVKAGFDTLVKRGYPAEMAYFEVLHELKLIVDLVQEGGLEHMWSRVSETARYGGRTRGPALVTETTRKTMDRMLDAIEDGSFAREWVQEYRSGMARFHVLRQEGNAHGIETVGRRLRQGMQKNGSTPA